MKLVLVIGILTICGAVTAAPKEVRNEEKPRITKTQDQVFAEKAIALLKQTSLERAQVFESAQAELNEDKTPNPTRNQYLLRVLTALVAEAPQRNSIFTADKITQAYGQVKNSEAAIENLGEIVRTYGVLVSLGRTADHSTLRLAITEIVKRKLPSLSPDEIERRTTDIQNECALFGSDKRTTTLSTRK